MLSSFLISSPLLRRFPQEEGGNKGMISRRTRTIYKVRSTTLFSLRPFAPQVFSQVLPFHSLNLADAEPCLLRALDSFCSSLPRISVGASQPSALPIHPSSVLLPSLPFSTRLVCHVFCLAPFLVMCLCPPSSFRCTTVSLLALVPRAVFSTLIRSNSWTPRVNGWWGEKSGPYFSCCKRKRTER